MDNKKYLFVVPKKRKKSGNSKHSKYIINTLVYVLSVVLLFAAVPMMINTFTSADGCTHVCDSECGFVASSPCTYVHEHNDDCGYDEDEGLPCNYVHVHSADCGFAEGAPCTYVCVEFLHEDDTNNVDDNDEEADLEDDADELVGDDDPNANAGDIIFITPPPPS
ncbi:MAG: hypothetical protein FWE83_11615 [Oscillospiraceae bacterium]|nr:hypothetical protein [Oscillospiraceae bacterium]